MAGADHQNLGAGQGGHGVWEGGGRGAGVAGVRERPPGGDRGEAGRGEERAAGGC
jgi:hypothetical protein